MSVRCAAILAALALIVEPFLHSLPLSAGASDHGSVAAVRIALQPVVAGGLSSPILVRNAHDDSGRLFVVEQTGRIRILCGCQPELRTFLDLSSKITAGGEQGLLGLAFHPAFKQNRRFFVNYTRKADGATVVSEFRASESDPASADPEEKVLLTISQPFSNHNGGMIEFGPDGYLYIGMGDGGSANDPGNRAQNPQELLGKILRIDVDRPGPGTPYGIPPDNPYASSSAGRPEIFALGLRNPWRFSFDRATGQLYAGDVGQGLVEEVSIIKLGGNYGWRVIEGSRCTGLGPAPCDSPGFLPPVATYTHSQGRCSITGGYVYRGRKGTLPLGTYVFGDYCTGEILLLNAGEVAVLADTASSISSFGEDEAGELYVVGLGGTIDRIVNPDAPGPSTTFFPYLRTLVGPPGGADESTGFAVTNLDSSSTSLTFRAYGPDGSLVQGPDVVNPQTVNLAASAQLSMIDTQVFGRGFGSQNREGWVRLEGSTSRLTAFFLAFDSRLSMIDGAPGGADTLTQFVMPDPGTSATTRIHVANPGPDSVRLNAQLVGGDGSVRASATRSTPGNGVLSGLLQDLFPSVPAAESDYLRFTSTHGVVPIALTSEPGRFSRALSGLDASAGGVLLYCPQYVVGGGYRSVLHLVNLEADGGVVTLRLFGDDGSLIGGPKALPINGSGKIVVADTTFFGDFGGGLTQGYVEISSSAPRLTGSISYGDASGRVFSASLPLVRSTMSRIVFGQIASDATYYTGIALVNPGSAATDIVIEALDSRGASLGSATVGVAARGRSARLLTEFIPGLAGRDVSSGSIRVTATRGIAAFAVFGTIRLESLSAIAGQAWPD